MASEVYFDRENGVEIWNDSGVRSDAVIRAMQGHPQLGQMIGALEKWQTETRGSSRRARAGRSMIDRDRYVTPSNIFDQFRVAIDAVENDDTVGGWMETTENLMFEDVTFQVDDPYEQDIWNQVAENLWLDDRMKEAYRGYGTCSQVYPFVWWGVDSFKVATTRTPGGRASKKTFDNLRVPVAISFLDPLKVVPVGNLMFNQEQLAYLADISEVAALNDAVAGNPNADPTAARLVTRPYKPDTAERRVLGELGIDTQRLYLLNPRSVFRYTATRRQYNRFAACRMKPVFPLLDMKHQLREMDRAFLIGGLNFILVVTQGSDKKPGTPVEIAKLGMAVRTLGRVPLLIGDNRLEVKIVAPPMENTLENEKYQTLNAPIVAYLYRMVMSNHAGGSGDDQIKAARMVGRGLNALRKRQGKHFMRQVFNRMWKENEQLTHPATMKFGPRRIELDFDPALAQLMLEIYDHRDISRDTMLSFVDADQEEEAAKKQREKEVYDDIFETIVPFTKVGPDDGEGDPENPRSSGRRKGGNRNGGGSAPGSGQGKPARDPRPKRSQRRQAAAEDHHDDDDDGTEDTL